MQNKKILVDRASMMNKCNAYILIDGERATSVDEVEKAVLKHKAVNWVPLRGTSDIQGGDITSLGIGRYYFKAGGEKGKITVYKTEPTLRRVEHAGKDEECWVSVTQKSSEA